MPWRSENRTNLRSRLQTAESYGWQATGALACKRRRATVGKPRALSLANGRELRLASHVRDPGSGIRDPGSGVLDPRVRTARADGVRVRNWSERSGPDRAC